MKKIGIITLLLLAIVLSLNAQNTPEVFRQGKLDNGLTYYIRHTEFKKGVADFYLVQNVGSMVEEEHQNGLAHFLEHMAFNGTENFPNGIQSFLKRRGVEQFNAYTGQDETVYHLNRVPTAAGDLVDSCLLILRDWSGFLLLDPKEIDKERGVILEERRSTRDVGARMRDQADKYIYNNSKYAIHNVIGPLEVLEHFTPADISSLYHDFYRPDQQAVIVVGDIDVATIENKINNLFAPIAKRVNPKQRKIYEIEDNLTPNYLLALDPEVPAVSITIMKRIKAQEPKDLEDMMKRNLIKNFYNKMVSNRLSLYVDIESPSFTGISVNYGSLTRGYDSYNIMVRPYLGDDSTALREVLEQLEIIHRFGFTEKEWKDQIEAYTMGLDETERFKDKLSNDVYVKMYQNNFLKGNPITSVDEDIAISRKILKELSLDDLKKWLAEWYYNDKNLLFLVDGSDSNYKYLTKDEIIKIRSDVKNADVKVKNYDIVAQKLMDFDVKGGEIVKQSKIKSMGASKWVLDNGLTVYFKQESHDRGKITMIGESYGGKSLLSVADIPNGEALSSLSLRSGLYKHDGRMMAEILKGQSAAINFRLGETNESVSGGCDVKDAQTLFELVYLMFEKPRFDRNDFDKFVKLSRMELRSSPKGVMDEVNEKVQNIRMKESDRRWDTSNEKFFDAMNFDRMVEIYKERLNNAADFTFYIVGDIAEDKAKELVTKYLGSLKSTGAKETYVLHNLKREDSVTETITAEIPDQKFIVNMEFYNKLKMSPKNDLQFEVMTRILTDRLNAEIREEQGGTYGVNLESYNATFPETKQFVGISFQSSVELGEKMRILVHEIIVNMLKEGVTDQEVEDVVMMLKKSNSNSMRNRGNSYYMEALRSYVDTGKDLTAPKYFENIIDKVRAKDIQSFSKRFFTDAQCVDIAVKSKIQ